MTYFRHVTRTSAFFRVSWQRFFEVIKTRITKVSELLPCRVGIYIREHWREIESSRFDNFEECCKKLLLNRIAYTCIKPARGLHTREVTVPSAHVRIFCYCFGFGPPPEMRSHTCVSLFNDVRVIIGVE